MIREEVSGAPERVYLHVNDGDDCWCCYHFEGDGDHKEDRTLVAFVREQAWRPIETAPKDGTWQVVARFTSEGVLLWWQRARWSTTNNRGTWKTEGGYCDPTHWISLPPSPTGDTR